MNEKGGILSVFAMPIMLTLGLIMLIGVVLLFLGFFGDVRVIFAKVGEIVKQVLGIQTKCGETDGSYMTCVGTKTDKIPDSASWDGCPDAYPYRIPVGGCRITEGFECCANSRYEDKCSMGEVSICSEDVCPVDCGVDGTYCDGRTGLGPLDVYDYVSGEELAESDACYDGCRDCMGLKGDRTLINDCPHEYPFKAPQDLDDFCESGKFCCQK